MKISFKLKDIKPCSVNKAYVRGGRTLSQDARRYRKRLLTQCTTNTSIQSKFERIRGNFDRLKHGLEIIFNFHIPSNIFYTKLGYISRLSGDADNFNKLTIDFLTNPKYVDHIFPKTELKCSSLGIDDQYVTSITSKKSPSFSELYVIEVEIKIVDLIKQ